ncbi:MAG TPA: vitamin K epoxide reductase family protein [Candidatus Paceibacterota bacterium]|jgi:uncharacterized membrane protein|nr:vitamin K epoxide reductase family protein [Candidatus Paceibacterota bacterium]
MSRSVLLALVLALSFLGVADSWYLYQSAVTDTALSCDIGAGLDGCNIVAQSPYSQLFDVPLALYGVLFFAIVFALSLALYFVQTRGMYRTLYGLGIFGALASIVFLYIQFALIQALCIYCIFSAGIAFLILFLARILWKHHAPPFLVPIR